MYYDNPTHIDIDGFRIATYPHGPKDGTPIVLIHGWPELAYSWDTTVPALVDAGYRVIAYDLLGYGRSDAPQEIEHYGIANLVAHLEAILDHYGFEKALLCGHDWGGIILWHAVRILKHRTMAAISISTPHVGQAPVDPMAIFERRYGKDHYFVEFRDRHQEVDALFRSNPDAFFRMMFRTSPKDFTFTPSMTEIPKRFADYLNEDRAVTKGLVLTEEQLAVYAKAYDRTGFLPGMNYYRNTTENWRFADGLSQRIDVPTLMLSPENDFFLPPSTTDGMVETVPDLTRAIIPDCGHWAMWDQPEAVNGAILGWLDARGF